MDSTHKITNHIKLLPNILSHRMTTNPWQEKMDRLLKNTVLQSTDDALPIKENTSEAKFSSAAKSIADRVHTEGAILFPGAISGELLDHLRSEFQQIIGTSDHCNYEVDKHDGAVCVRIDPRPSLSKQLYPVTNAFFDSQVFHEITQHFYNGDSRGFKFNSAIFVHETPETKSPLSGTLHWDRAQALKFWIYIDDVPMEAGPMRIQPGTTATNKSTRIKKKKSIGLLEGGKDNTVIKTELQMKYLTGSAGTILVHDSDCSHGASPVAEGYTRRIMRGHCRSARPTKTTRLKKLFLNPESFHMC